MFKWSIVANLTSSLGYTASSLGNHEFDDGVSDLEDFTHATKAKICLTGDTIRRIDIVSRCFENKKQ